MADPTFKELWLQLPVVSRTVTAAAVIVFVISALNPYWAVKFWFSYDSLKHFEVWRLLTAPLAFQGSTYGALMSLFYFYTNLSNLEGRKFVRKGDLLFYLVVVSVAFMAVGPYFGLYAYLGGISGALIYTCAQESASEPVKYFVFDTKRGYIPWFNVVFGLLMGGPKGMAEPLLGIVIAHFFLFFNEILPSFGGPRLQTPQWLLKLDKKPTGGTFGAASAAWTSGKVGGGHRLGGR